MRRPDNPSTNRAPGGLDAIADSAKEAGAKGLPPIHLWNPPDCGDIPMRIAADGIWHYQNSPIGRQPLVRLFASVLKCEGDRHVLVTPVEKCGIQVDDAPFIAVEMDTKGGAKGQELRFRTNMDDWVTCGPDNMLRFEREEPAGGLKPYLYVRHGLWAKLSRALFYELVALGEERDVDGRAMFGVASQGCFFAMAPAETLRDLA